MSSRGIGFGLVGDGDYVFTFKNYGENPSDIDIQYESLLSTDYDFQDVCFGNNRFIAVGGISPVLKMQSCTVQQTEQPRLE